MSKELETATIVGSRDDRFWFVISACVISAVDFFNQINMLYGTITEFCTAESCAVMSAGPKWVLNFKI